MQKTRGTTNATWICLGLWATWVAADALFIPDRGHSQIATGWWIAVVVWAVVGTAAVVWVLPPLPRKYLGLGAVLTMVAYVVALTAAQLGWLA